MYFSRFELSIPDRNRHAPDRLILFPISRNTNFVFPSDFSVPVSVPDQTIQLRERLRGFPNRSRPFSSLAVRAVFMILNPTIDARLLLVCYGATPASSACTGGNPSGRRCACINSKATAARPASILPLCFSSRVPSMLDAMEASGLHQDLRPVWFHLS